MTPATPHLSAVEARRAVLAAQLPADATTGLDVLRRLGLFQLDPLRRVERAHRLTALARLPRSHRTARVDESLWWPGSAVVFETFSRVATLFPVEEWPLHVVSRERATRRHQPAVAEAEAARRIVADSERGVTVRELEAESEERSGGWSWSRVRRAAEFLIWHGELVSTERTPDGRRIYDLAERRIPSALLNASVPYDDALDELVRRAVGTLGVATAADVARHVGVLQAPARESLERAGLERVRVEGWREDAWMTPDAVSRLSALVAPVRRAPRLIGPFDTLLRDRGRALRVFGFDYTFEAYKPAHTREHGHYVMAVLQGDALTSRVDAHRSGATLVVDAVTPEPGPETRMRRAGAAAVSAAERLAAQLGFDTALPA